MSGLTLLTFFLPPPLLPRNLPFIYTHPLRKPSTFRSCPDEAARIKKHLDGELLLLAILRMSNVVIQAPSRDDAFLPSLTASSANSLKVLISLRDMYN